jgi:peptidyl-prolyl cis-trans isomerase SurA
MRTRLATLLLLLATATAGGQDIAPAEPTPGEPIVLDRVVAVVGDRAILWSDVQTAVNERRAAGLQLPPDSAGQMEMARQILAEMVDEELIVQKARASAVEVAEADIERTVDQQVRRVRGQFQSEGQFRAALQQAGLGSPEEYRRRIAEQVRRRALQEQYIGKLRGEGQLIRASVSEKDVAEAFEKNREALPKRPATVGFAQVVVSPQPSPAADSAAKAKLESLLAEIRSGADFELIAKRESMDGSADVGGDLGWNRRGAMVPEFEFWMFRLAPGQISPVFRTAFGWHIVRVDRVQPAEVRARHILLRPHIDSSDVERARLRADSATALWRQGVGHDSLVARFHDQGEEKLVPAFELAQLPESYRAAFEGKQVGDVTDPFRISREGGDMPKFVVARITSRQEAGEYSVADLRERIREQLVYERSIARLIGQLRRETYVDVRL